MTKSDAKAFASQKELSDQEQAYVKADGANNENDDTQNYFCSSIAFSTVVFRRTISPIQTRSEQGIQDSH